MKIQPPTLLIVYHHSRRKRTATVANYTIRDIVLSKFKIREKTIIITCFERSSSSEKNTHLCTRNIRLLYTGVLRGWLEDNLGEE